jgi:hypothetical protein
VCRTEVPVLGPPHASNASACHLPAEEKERIFAEIRAAQV